MFIIYDAVFLLKSIFFLLSKNILQFFYFFGVCYGKTATEYARAVRQLCDLAALVGPNNK